VRSDTESEDNHIFTLFQKEKHRGPYLRRETIIRNAGVFGGRASRNLYFILIAGILLASLLVAGCSSRPPEGGEKPPAPDILVEYTRTGGIAGFDDHLVVFDNGQAIFSRKQSSGIFTLSNQELGELRNLLDTAGFPSLEPEYPAPEPGADYFQYTITYGGKTVTTETGGVPPNLAPVIGELDYLLTEYS
jgi:hypothetical protein